MGSSISNATERDLSVADLVGQIMEERRNHELKDFDEEVIGSAMDLLQK